MHLPRSSNQKQTLNIIPQKKLNSKNSQNDTNNKILAKFFQQTQQKLPTQTKKPYKTSLLIPQLKIENINLFKQQSTKFEKNNDENNKRLSRVETKETKGPFITHRHSQQQMFATERQSSRHFHSPLHSLLKSNNSQNDSDSINTEADKEELLLMEIKQLKRENTFLKKKIRELNKQINGGFLPEQYQQSSSNKENFIKKKGAPKINFESLHLSVNLFFEEIRNLLTSVTQLFRIDFSEDQIKKFQFSHSEEQMVHELNEEICPLRRHDILKKYFLNRKLQRLAFEQDQKRYELLLTVFTEYYTFKQESQKKVVETIDSMVMYMNDLSKWLIEKAHEKKMKSEIFSQANTERELTNSVTPPKFDSLKVPVHTMNYVVKIRGQTLSPMAKTK